MIPGLPFHEANATPSASDRSRIQREPVIDSYLSLGSLQALGFCKFRGEVSLGLSQSQGCLTHLQGIPRLPEIKLCLRPC